MDNGAMDTRRVNEGDQATEVFDAKFYTKKDPYPQANKEEEIKHHKKPSFKYCPICSADLIEDRTGHPHCSTCKWTHYDNPIPVACVLISAQGDPDRRIVLVRRGIPPFKGEWCLPCGYMNQHEIPKVAAVRESKEETGLDVRLEKLLCVCNPMPFEINQITISYLARPVGGILKAGDDAADVGWFRKDNCPRMCFRSHQMLVEKWFAGRFGEITGVDLD